LENKLLKLKFINILKAHKIKSNVSDQCSVSGFEIYPGLDNEHDHERLMRGGEARNIIYRIKM